MVHIKEEFKINKDIKVRQFQTGDEEAIVDILTKSFPGWGYKDPLQHWKWKYLDTPLKSTIVIAEIDGKLVGVNQDILLNIKIGTENVFSQFGADAATHPDFRGIGVYKKIADLWMALIKERKIKFELSLSKNPIVIKDSAQRGNFSFPHKVSYMVRIRDVNLHLKMRPMENAWVIGKSLHLLNNLNKFRYASQSNDKTKNDFIITKIESFDESLDKFWESIKDEYYYIMEKNCKYLNWRICDPRAGKFVVKQAVREGKLLGYIVMELRESNVYSEGFIVDLIALPEKLDVAKALLEDGCRFFDELGVNVIYYMVVEGHPYQKLSSNCGFIFSHITANIICFQNHLEKELEVMKTAHPNRISFGYIDTL